MSKQNFNKPKKEFGNNKTFQKKGRNFKKEYNNKLKGADDKSDMYEKSSDVERKDLIINDPEWYTKNKALSDPAGKVAFPYPTGAQIKEIKNFSSPVWHLLGSQGLSDNWYAPGICRVNVVPCFGWQDDESSSINVAAESEYAYLRTFYTGSLKATKNDIIKFMCDMGTALALINWGFRCYGTYAYYEYENSYLCKTVMDAQGISYDSLKEMGPNLFQTRINDLIARLASLVCPDTMSFFKRSAFLYKHMYVDGDSIKDQMYCFTPVGYYDHVMDNSHEASYLKFTPITGWDDNGAITVTHYFEILEEFINHMFYSYDLGTISGYLAKAHEGHLLGFEYLDSGFKTDFLNSRDVLEQIKHGYVNPFIDLHSLDLYEDDSTIQHLICHPTAYIDKSDNIGNMTRVQAEFNWIFGIQMNFFNVRESSLTPEYVFEWSRFMVAYEQVQFSSDNNRIVATAKVHCGSDFIKDIQFYRFTQAYNAEDSTLEQGRETRIFKLDMPVLFYNSEAQTQVTIPYTQISNARAYAHHATRDFPYAPKFVEIALPFNGQATAWASSAFLGYTQNTECNHGIMPEEVLRMIHRVAWYNMVSQDSVELLRSR